MNQPAVRIFNGLWSRDVGRSTIDLWYDESSDTISACDVSGSYRVFDSLGNSIEGGRTTQAGWGVSHQYKDGHCLIAIASADKQSSKGRVTLDQTSRGGPKSIDVEGECWDVLQDDSHIFYSNWSGQIARVPIESFDESSVELLDLPGPVYGLSWQGNAILAVVGGKGVYRVAIGTEMEAELVNPAQNACYNVADVGGKIGVVSGSASTAPIGSNLELLKGLTGAVSAIASIDDLLLVGTLDGELAIYAPLATDRPLSLMRFAGGIWNIASVADRSVAYLAVGDGSVHCVAVEPGQLAESRTQVIDSWLGDLEGFADELRALEDPYEIAFAVSSMQDMTSEMSESDLQLLGSILYSWTLRLDEDMLSLIFGKIQLLLGDADSAVIALQRINPEQGHFVQSLMPLSEAFETLGSLSSATRVLQDNLQRFDASQVDDTLFRLGTLWEKRQDRERALQAYEALSYLRHSYPGVQESLRRLSARSPQASDAVITENPISVSISDVIVAEPGALGKRRKDEYDLLSYIRYESSPPSDEAKKILETGHMESIVSMLTLRTTVQTALDIGCASGRWPTWIARRGFEAHGYDISATSMEICRGIAERQPGLALNFELHDMANGPLIEDYFSLVTCMMGTFNHIDAARRPAFLASVRKTLTLDGLFAFTMWNPASPFCDFLQLDSQSAKDNLRRNALDIAELPAVLDEAGLRMVRVEPLCLLPNQCYDAWEDSLTDVETIRELDNFLKQVLNDARAQMFFVLAEVDRA